jgi:hypothetical protein
MTISMQLMTNPTGAYGGADFEAEIIPGVGDLRLVYDKSQFSHETHAALTELARGLDFYAAEPTPERGPLPSAVFTVTKLLGDTSTSNLRAFRTAGVFAASDFHKRVNA